MYVSLLFPSIPGCCLPVHMRIRPATRSEVDSVAEESIFFTLAATSGDAAAGSGGTFRCGGTDHCTG